MTTHTSVPDGYPAITHLDQPSVCLRIALALSRRSGRRWLVTPGPLGSHGRLAITPTPDRRLRDGTMSEADRLDLASLLGLDTVGPSGVVVPGGGYDHYVELIDRAEGRAPRVLGRTDPWDAEE